MQKCGLKTTKYYFPYLVMNMLLHIVQEATFAVFNIDIKDYCTEEVNGQTNKQKLAKIDMKYSAKM